MNLNECLSLSLPREFFWKTIMIRDWRKPGIVVFDTYFVGLILFESEEVTLRLAGDP
jgi:hypothetical protein